MDLRALAKSMKTKQINARQVIIDLGDKKLVFDSPLVVEAELMGNKVFQVIGEPRIEENINEEDVKIIMEKTGVSREEAIKVLKETGDVVDAIEKILQS